MKFQTTRIAGVVEVRLEPHEDERGFFARAWCTDEFSGAGFDVEWVQMNIGRSDSAGTLRGMHYQREPWGEWKLVRCVHGSLYDVAVDLREDSATRHQWFGVELTAKEGNLLLIPPGCAHGYLTLTDRTDLLYQTSHRYAPEGATGVRYDDPAFGIEWPTRILQISDQDQSWPLVQT
jgi:dTDP-4-dehydrorhamnose 3,5-epimerase